MSQVYDGARRARRRRMGEFVSLDRCASYVAARAALSALQRTTASWPEGLAGRARRAASATIQITAEATLHDHGSAARRRCLRDAITTAIGVTAAIDIARTLGFDGSDLVDAQRVAGRTVALLGMFLHANTSPIPEDVPPALATVRRGKR
jgi:hypothetical protein